MKPQRLFYILLALWVLADLLQAVFTPVHADEAYYALYGSHLDWGYYDHPPMVALLTAFSSLLFHGNLSIRFATVLLHSGTVWLIWKILPHKSLTNRDVWTFFATAASLVMFSVYGFITTPDAPLLFFSALFFYLYKHYLDAPGWPLALALGVTLAAMLYSKYMAVLVLGFVALSNPKLLKDPKAWAAVLVAALLFVPHILWQIRNGFPSFQYHLLDRNMGFRMKYPLEFIPNQLLVFNPVCFCLALYFCWKKRKTDNLFERACIFTIAGFILFFWVMTVKGHAEPHWTVAVSIPMVILLWQELRNKQWHKWLIYGIVPIFGLLALLRIAAPSVLDSGKFNVFGNHHKYNVIHKYCGEAPAVFFGSFQAPSMYHFYTGNNAMQVSSIFTRRTQFDIWRFDKEIQGKPACIVNPNVYKRGGPEGYDLIEEDGVTFYLHKTESFQGTNQIQVNIDQYRIAKDSLFLDLTLYNPYELDFAFNNPEFPITLYVAYLREGEHSLVPCSVASDMVIPAGGSLRCKTAVRYIPDAPVVICLNNIVNCSVNSKPILLKR